MNWTRLRGFFPASREIRYLDHLAGGPVSTRVVETLERFAHECAQRGGLDTEFVYQTERDRIRSRVGAWLRTTPDSVAFVRDAREGLALLLTGFDWKRGDRLVLHGFDAARLPGRLHLHERGVEVRRVAPRGYALDRDRLARALTEPGARMLLLPSIDPRNGARIDLRDAADLARERGVLLAVDASSSAGALPERPSETGIDFWVTDGHRRLGSVRGCGIAFCDDTLRDALSTPPAAVGRGSHARRLDTIPAHSPGLAALGAAIDLWLEVGTAAVGQRVLELSAYLAHGLAARGLRLGSPIDPTRSAGVVLFAPVEGTANETQRALSERGLHLGCHGQWLRASPHCYNAETEIDELIQAL